MRTACVNIHRSIATALVVSLFVACTWHTVHAQEQAIDVIGAHQRGKIIDGTKAGTWTYFNDAGETTLKFDYDNARVLYFKPDTSTYLVSLDGLPWTPAKLSRPVIFPGELAPLQRKFVEKMASGPAKPVVGISWLQFVVSKDGVATKPRVINATSVNQEKKLLEFFAEMPKQWIAGMVDTVFVDCLMSARVEVVVGDAPRYSTPSSDDKGTMVFYSRQALSLNLPWSQMPAYRHPGLFFGDEQFVWSSNDSVLTIKTDNGEWYSGFQFDVNGSLLKRFASPEPFLFSCGTNNCRELLINFYAGARDYRNATYNTQTSALVLSEEHDQFLIVPSPDRRHELFGSRHNGNPSAHVKNVATGSITQIPRSDGMSYGMWLNSDSILFSERPEGIDSNGWMGRVFIYSVTSHEFKDASWLQDRELMALSPDGKGALIKDREHFIPSASDLYYYDFATAKTKRILKAGVPQRFIFWSGDPDLIYYHSDTDLYRKSLSSGDKELIVSNVIMPRMNHARTAIAFVNSTNGNFYMCDPDGKSVRLIIVAPK